YLLLSGRVKVVAVTDNGYETLLALRGPGDVVGEMAAVDGGTRSATVTALEPVTGVAVPVAAFRAFVRARPAAAAALLGMLADRLRESDRARAGFGAYGTAVRLARRLLGLADAHGRVAADGTVALEVGLTQQDLAASIGASRESVGRDLALFDALGIVSRRRRPIVIADVDALREFAHGDRSELDSRPRM
nr:Crp/Fnr family transcriptional regulator [Micromonospora sp. DSM 115978]